MSVRDSWDQSWEDPCAIQIHVPGISASAPQSLWGLSLTTGEPTVAWVPDKG